MVLAPLERVYATNAWPAGQSEAHLCAAGSIRAMPETEIPPVLRGAFIDLPCGSKKVQSPVFAQRPTLFRKDVWFFRGDVCFLPFPLIAEQTYRQGC